MKDKPDEFAEWDLRKKRLVGRLANSPVVTVIGVTDATGATGGCLPGDDDWTLSFAFAAWRLEDSEVRTDRLNIRRQVSHDDLKQHMDQIKPFQILRARIRLAETTESGKPHGLLIDDVKSLESDEGLNEWVVRLQTPVTLEDKTFGTFTLDKRLNSFDTETTLQNKRITLHLSGEEPDDVKKALKTAHTLWQLQDAWNRRIREFAVQRLLPLKNGTWLEEDETEVSENQFKNRMTLEAVTVYSDGSFDFWHDDGDLFCGHAIKIDGTLTDGPTDADIYG